MKIRQICMLVLLCLGVIPAVQAQTYDKVWKQVEQAKLQYWAGMIRDCQHSGLKTKEWLANHGISKDTYYYWYKKVQTVCVEAMEMPDTLSMPEFMSLPVPAEPANVPVESAIRSYAVVTMHIGKAGIEAEWDKLLD